MRLTSRSTPTPPTLTVHVGVSGHRDLHAADRQALQAASRTLFTQLGQAAQSLWTQDQAAETPRYAPTPPILRCLCGIAEGADTIFADAALDAQWQLAAILPFPPDEYAHDFAGKPLEKYRALLDRSTNVLALAGSRAPHATPYAAVGQEIVQRSDLLLIVWDGEPPRGPGGTGDVVAIAQRHRLPVAAYPAAGPVALRWITPEPPSLDALLRDLLRDPATAARHRLGKA